MLPSKAGAVYDQTTHTLTLSGASNTTMLMASIVVFNSQDVVLVVMSGPGGLTRVGYAIGHMIQLEGATALVPEGDKCISACALAFLGSPRPILEGELWLHASYIEAVPILASLYDVFMVGGRGAIDAVRYYSSIGYGLGFTAYLNDKTTPQVFLVVTDMTKLLEYKVDPQTATLADLTKPFNVILKSVDLTNFYLPQRRGL